MEYDFLQFNWETLNESAVVVDFNETATKSLSDRQERDNLLVAVSQKNIKSIQINAKNIEKWDVVFLTLLFDLYKAAQKNSIQLRADVPLGVQKLLQLAFADKRNPQVIAEKNKSFLENIGENTLKVGEAIASGWQFLKEVAGSLKRFVIGKAVMRKIDFMFAIEECSFKALGIVSLICFMVGVIFGFVGALQLQLFGAQIFIASLVMLSMVRVMGAMMTGIIMSGRTGSAYAATIGSMQVNEEVDALKTMGINVIDFLLLPRMIALIISMPLLTVFADFMGVLGGAFVGIFMMDLAPGEYWKYSLEALQLSQFLIGILHGAVFGVIIALCGCYYGIKSGKNADSVGSAATSAVVASIVWIIVATAVLTVIFEVGGL